MSLTASVVGTAFGSLRSGLLVDVGYAVALLVALALVAFGLLLLLRWARRALSAAVERSLGDYLPGDAGDYDAAEYGSWSDR